MGKMADIHSYHLFACSIRRFICDVLFFMPMLYCSDFDSCCQIATKFIVCVHGNRSIDIMKVLAFCFTSRGSGAKLFIPYCPNFSICVNVSHTSHPFAHQLAAIIANFGHF